MADREGVLIVPLHGELPVAEQDRAVRPSDRRKIILSTNVAESSVTIDGVTAVVDSGLARTAVHSSWSGLQRLTIGKISRASALQRAGRAGRTQPGRCLRLYTAADFAARPEFDQPECARSDLAETVLELHAAGVRDAQAFDWYEAPPREAIGAAEDLLKRLGAILDDGSLTTTGRQMIRFPLHPRLSRILIEGASCGAERDAAAIAAILNERDIFERRLFGRGALERRASRGAGNAGHMRSGPSDLLDRLDLFHEAELSRFSPDVLHRLGLDSGAVNAVNRVRRRLLALLRRAGENAVFADKNTGASIVEIGAQGANPERALLAAILAGFPDRVARRRSTARQKGSQEIEVLLCGGGQATLSSHSVVTQSEFLVVVEAEEKQAGRSSGVEIRLASAIDAEMLFEMYFERLCEVESVVWNDKSDRAESVRRLFYDDLIIDETAAGVASGESAWRVLGEKALSRGPAAFLDLKELDCTLARLEFAASVDSSGGWPDQMPDADSVLMALCKGRSSFAELREAARRGEWREALFARLGAVQRRRLDDLAPERVSIGRRKQVRVEYERGKTPWIGARIQDFFGLKKGPRIADGRVPLVLHLLAPNNRPVQVTSDLEGFWIRHYSSVRRELSRRYPRHAWPEDPLAQ
jgi:ATP-dependent helicase HrpB